MKKHTKWLGGAAVLATFTLALTACGGGSGDGGNGGGEGDAQTIEGADYNPVDRADM